MCGGLSFVFMYVSCVVCVAYVCVECDRRTLQEYEKKASFYTLLLPYA